MGLNPNQPVQLTAGDAVRLARSNRRTERFDAARYNGMPPIASRDSSARYSRSVRVTGMPAGGTPYLYPGLVYLYGGYTGGNTWADLPGSDCWVIPKIDSETLDVDVYVNAQLVGDFGGKPIFAVDASVSTVYDRYLSQCKIVNPSTGTMTGIRVVMARADGTTYCVDVPSCTGSACPLAWYCTNGVVSSVAAGSPPPTGFTGGPWPTELDADHGCPVPEVVITSCCGGASIRLPGRLFMNLANRTGFAFGHFPNSVAFNISTYSSGDATYVPVSGGYGNWYMHMSISCVTGGWRLTCNIGIPGTGTDPSTYEYCASGQPNLFVPVAPWNASGSDGNDFIREFTCATTSWTPGSGERVATLGTVCSGSFPGTMDLILST